MSYYNFTFGMGIKEREYVAVSAAGGKDSAFSMAKNTMYI